MNISQQLTFNQLTQTLFNLVCHSCQIIGNFDNFNHLIWKDSSNPVTEVDYLVQAYLTSSIKKLIADEALKVVGEEDLSFSEVPQFQSLINGKLEALQQTISKKNHQLNQEFTSPNIYESQDLCIWIDPLDCTAGFTNNRLYEVTILVGISYKGQPICGIIGHPFTLKNKKAVFEPTVMIGSSQLSCQKAFEYTIKLEQWNFIHRPFHSGNKVAISFRDSCPTQCKIMQKLHLESVRCGGAGYKCLKVIKGEVDTVFLMNLKTSKWDTCAGQAIIKGMGGHVIDPELESIDYSDTKQTTNEKGFFMTTDIHTYHNFTIVVNELKEHSSTLLY